MTLTEKTLRFGKYDCITDKCPYKTNKRNATCTACKFKQTQANGQKTYEQRQIEKAKENARQANIAEIELAKQRNSYPVNPKQITRISAKKRKELQGYQTAKAQLAEEGLFCRGCGITNAVLTCSHRIPQKEPEGKRFISDVRNLDWMCISCHEKVENFDLDKLSNGKEIEVWVKEKAPNYYKRKQLQRLRNIEIIAKTKHNHPPTGR